MATTTTLLAGLPRTAHAQFNQECGVGETQMYIQVGGTDKLTACTDYFDDVDPYASVTVGEDRLGISRLTKRIDNDAEPQWNQVLDFGCVVEDSKIAFRVRDSDYFGDESCLGPLGILGPWPASGAPMVLCESQAADATTTGGMPGTGCISFTLYYGDNIPDFISNPNSVSVTSPSTLPAGVPSRPDTPDAPLPTVTKRPATTNTTRPATTTTNPSESTDPRVAPTPRIGGQDPNPTKTPPPLVNNPNGGRRPALPQGPRNVTKPAVMQSPAGETQDKNKAGGRHNKGAAVAGGILATLALVGIGAGILASRRRLRTETHEQNLEVDEEGGRVHRGEMEEDATPGSIAVL